MVKKAKLRWDGHKKEKHNKVRNQPLPLMKIDLTKWKPVINELGENILNIHGKQIYTQKDM